jgi:membrane protein YqaA with SNARE-associated domain
MSIVLPIPYTLFIYVAGGFLDPLALSMASGLGSAIGELSGYVIGYYGQTVLSEERRRKMKYMVKIFDRYGALAIFFFALTPLPDDLLFIPLGVMRYNFVKAFLPSIFGKIIMSFIIAYSGRMSLEFMKIILVEGGWVGTLLTALLLTAIILLMLKIDWEKVFEKRVSTKR